MKKSIYILAAVAALFAFSSCSKESISPAPEVEGKTVNIRFSAVNAGDTKTGVTYESGTYAPYWNKGDEIGVIFDSFAEKSKVDAVLANANEKGQYASFNAEGVTLNNGTVPGEEGTVYSFYPASAFQAVVAAENAVRVNLASSQTPAAVDTYDPAADILVGKPSDYFFDNSEKSFVADIPFARIMSVVKITLKAGEGCPADLAVNKLTMTAPDGTVLTGRVKLSLNTISGGDSPLSDWTVKNKEVSAIYKGEAKPVIGGIENTVYLIVNPTSIESGSDVIFTIDTDDYTIEKTVNLKSPLAFPQGNVANIGLTIAGTNCTPKVAETRIWVESFKDVIVKEKQYQPDETGAAGTGVVDATKYDYGNDDKTNIRINENGHTATDPYLFLRANSTFTVSNIAVSEQSDLILSAQTKNAGSVTVKYKESNSEDWTEAGIWITEAGFSGQKSIFTVSNTATSIDLSFTAGSAAVIIDDFVLDTDTREALATPANVTAEEDATTSNKINVSWGAVENAGSYEITLSTAGEEDVVETSTTNSISFNSLEYSTEYSVKVKAISSDVLLYKDSEYSAAVEVSTGAQPAVMIYYEKVTTAPTDWCGDYLIVYETGNVAFDGSLTTLDAVSNTKAVEINNNKILATDDMRAIQFTVAFKTGSSTVYSLRSASGKYISGTTTTAQASNGLKQADTDANYEISFNGTTVESKSSDQQMDLKYNKMSGQTRFRFYKSGQEGVALYKLNDSRTALATPVITVTPDNAAKKITVSWNVVANAKDYTVTCTGQDAKTVALTTCAFTDLAYGEYTITVQANPADETSYKSSAKASKDVSIVDTTPVINAENPAAVEATATSVEVPYTVTNKVDGTNLTAAVTSGNWISNPQVTSDKVTFTLTANTASEQRTGTVTLSYAGAADKVITITQKGVAQTGYASLEELVAAGTPTSTGETVTVTFENKEILEIQSNQKGIWLPVNGAPNNKIEIYPNTAIPTGWVVGGWVSATLTCKWMKYNDNTWELCPSNWDDINYVGPVAKPEITLDGANATITCATTGATILYEIADAEPANFTHTYSDVVALTDGQTIWAKATLAGHPDSEVASKKYTAGGGTEHTLIIDGSQLTSTATNADTDKTYGENDEAVTITFSTGAKTQAVQSGAANNFSSNATILIGKSGAYIYNKTPIPGKITKFEIYANKGASVKVSVGVCFSTSAISGYSTGTNTYTATLSTLDNVYDCSSKIPDGAYYFWYQVTNANNSQVQFRITYTD